MLMGHPPPIIARGREKASQGCFESLTIVQIIIVVHELLACDSEVQEALADTLEVVQAIPQAGPYTFHRVTVHTRAVGITSSILACAMVDRPRVIDLLYLSTSLLWWQAVAAIRGVTSSHRLRHNARCTWRHSEGVRNGDNTAIRHAFSPLRPGRGVTAAVHGCPRGAAPIRPPLASRDTPGAHTEEETPNRFRFLVMRGPPADSLFPSWSWPIHHWMLVGNA
jgi:hypothetical protein